MSLADDVTAAPGRLARRPGVLVLLLVGGYLLVDLLVKLQGLSVFFGGVRVLGGFVSVATLATFLTDGLLVGFAIGLAGIGLSMTYSILDFANFAHGDTVSTGAFAGWAAAFLVGNLGAGPLDEVAVLDTGAKLGAASAPLAVLVGVVVAAVGTVGVVLLVDRAVYRPLRDADGISLLIASIGVALVLRYLLSFVFGAGRKRVARSGAEVVLFRAGGRGVSVTDNEVALLVVAGGLMLGVHLLLQRTKLGKSMRAMADNEDLARVTGIPTERVVRITWVVGAALAGVAGFLLVLESGTIRFNFGWRLLLLIFSAVILGGIGSIYGAMAGGVLIGLIDSLATVWLPSDLTRAAVFVALIAMLLLRPSGLFGGVSTA